MNNKELTELNNTNTMKKEVYTHRAVCANCGNRGLIEIPKGVTKELCLEVLSCENCGCKTYR